MAGPSIQMPTSLSQMFETDGQGQILSLKQEWAAFFNSLQQITYSVSRSGLSSSRPTAETPGRFIGMPYFDRSLGFDINLKTATAFASSDVWVDGAGLPV